MISTLGLRVAWVLREMMRRQWVGGEEGPPHPVACRALPLGVAAAKPVTVAAAVCGTALSPIASPWCWTFDLRRRPRRAWGVMVVTGVVLEWSRSAAHPRGPRGNVRTFFPLRHVMPAVAQQQAAPHTTLDFSAYVVQ